MHSRLTDRIFFAAPGEWTMWRCLQCGSGYLDPRPTEESIHLAYRNYYTHNEESELSANSLLSRLRLALGNDYRNSRYGAKQSFAIPFVGRIAAKLLPGARTHVDCEYRYLPTAAAERRLLDAGSGNGAFLRMARESGWDACGVEPDAAARRVADGQGFDVRASLGE